MKILVTGAAGFVGKAIVDLLAADAGNELIAAARRSAAEDGRPNVRRVAFDICRPLPDLVARGIGPLDAVIHAAGLAHRFGGVREDELFRVNAEGAAAVGRLARELGARRFVHISTVAVYGGYGAEVVDESFVCRPRGAYAESKLAGESAVRRALGDGAELAVLRPATVVGPGDPGNTTRLITALIRGRFAMIGNGSNFKTFVAADDLARAAETVVRSVNPVRGVFNIASDPVTVAEVVDAIRTAAGLRRTGFRLPSAPFAAVLAAGGPLARRMPRFSAAADTFRKWLSDERYGAQAFRAATGFEPRTDVLSEIARQTRALIDTK